MTVEVLGTVLGTAIQGQIVGGAPDCPPDINGTASNNETTIDIAKSSLEKTVSFPPCCAYCLSSKIANGLNDTTSPSSETSLPHCFRVHLHHLRPECCSAVLWGEGAKR